MQEFYSARVLRAQAQDEFVFTGFLACYWFWEKAITKKRMAILVKETKIKDVIIIINTRTRK